MSREPRNLDGTVKIDHSVLAQGQGKRFLGVLLCINTLAVEET
jgi:hypothetical protein